MQKMTIITTIILGAIQCDAMETPSEYEPKREVFQTVDAPTLNLDSKALTTEPKLDTSNISDVISKARQDDINTCDHLVNFNYDGFLNYEHLDIATDSLLNLKTLENPETMNESQIYYILRYNPQKILDKTEGQMLISFLRKNHDTKFLQNRKEESDSFIQLCIGMMYDFGNGAEQDSTLAPKYYQRAAQNGNIQAQSLLGSKYLDSEYYDRNDALEWLNRAANDGFPRAQFNLGLLYKKGQRVELDYNKALYWFQKSAGQGFAQGQACLG